MQYEEKDRDDVIQFYKLVASETNYLSFYEDEYSFTQSDFMLILRKKHEIVGIVTINIPTKRKNKHIGTLGIVVKRCYQKLGLGKELMTRAIDWCKQKQLRKIQLIVRTDNEIAVQLYKRFNFMIEGECKDDTCIDNVYYNTYIMSLWL